MNRIEIFPAVFDFFDTKEFQSFKQKASLNQSLAGVHKEKYSNGSINTMQIVADKFGISKTAACCLLKIKKEATKDILDDVLSGSITVSDAYDIVKSGGQKGKKCVYFISNIYSKKIKIGKTKRIYRRLKIISRYNAGDVELLLTIEGYTSLEKKLHKKFEKYRIKMTDGLLSEWFKPSQEILDFIEESKKKSPQEISTFFNMKKKKKKKSHHLISEDIFG